MTKSQSQREPRPFQFLKPASLPLRAGEPDAVGLARLGAASDAALPSLVNSLVAYTISAQNRRLGARAQPIPMGVLNRRRRAARSWLLAIGRGLTDAATRHAVATQWLPVLCGSGPELDRMVRPGRVLIEFVRGALTACLFDEAAANLLPHARALHVLETTLAAHLAAVAEQGVRARRQAVAASR